MNLRESHYTRRLPQFEWDEILTVMENPARNDAMLHKRESKSKGENRYRAQTSSPQIKGKVHDLLPSLELKGFS
jgi:hypothetical protein